jgi:hypothetical protein
MFGAQIIAIFTTLELGPHKNRPRFVTDFVLASIFPRILDLLPLPAPI